MAGQPQTRDARQTLERVLDAIPDLDAKYKQLIEDAFAAERIREVSVPITCKECGELRKYVIQVPLPDLASRIKGIDLLLTQAKGKPAETKVIDLNVAAVQTRAELEAMTDEQLALVAAAHLEEETDGKQGNASHARRRRSSAAGKADPDSGSPAARRRRRSRKADAGTEGEAPEAAVDRDDS